MIVEEVLGRETVRWLLDEGSLEVSEAISPCNDVNCDHPLMPTEE